MKEQRDNGTKSTRYQRQLKDLVARGSISASEGISLLERTSEGAAQAALSWIDKQTKRRIPLEMLQAVAAEVIENNLGWASAQKLLRDQGIKQPAVGSSHAFQEVMTAALIILHDKTWL